MNLSSNQREALKQLNDKSDREIDYSDIPELEFDKMGRPIVGKFYRPIKKSISLRMDVDVLDWFKTNSDQYQRLINKVCRMYMERHKR